MHHRTTKKAFDQPVAFASFVECNSGGNTSLSHVFFVVGEIIVHFDNREDVQCGEGIKLTQSAGIERHLIAASEVAFGAY